MQSPSSDDKKYFGTLEVKVFETREININWIIGKVENTPCLSEVKKHHSNNHQFSDVFQFKVPTAGAELTIEAWRKNLIHKDSLKGVFKVPISTLFDEQAHTGWYTLVRHVKSKEEKEKEKEAESAEEGEKAEKKEKKKKKEAKAEIRLEMKFTKNTPPKEVLTGIILQSQWDKERSGGPLINNPKWSLNPQFLLNVDNATDVSIKLRQPEDSSQRASFYVVHYDEFYNGRKKVVLDASEIVKIENFNNPIASLAVTSNMQLAKGRYVIIPFTETVPFTGPFTLAVSAKNMDDLDLYEIPKDPADNWTTLRVQGEWTPQTSGGGDILGLNWRKNPQYHLKLAQNADVCVVIEQDDTSRSTGVYVVKQIDSGKKAVDYSDEVGKTDSFKYLCSSGLKIPKLPAGNYVVIPCTFDPEVLGPFRLVAYISDPNATLSLIESAWKHSKELKGAWTEQLAGGSPNNVTSYINNPQYALKFHGSNPTNITTRFENILIQLVQESAHYEEASIGFLVITSKNGAQKLKAGDFGSEDIFCKPEGWVPKVDVVCRTRVEADKIDNTFIILPSTFKPDIVRPFQLNVYSDEDFTLEHL